MKRRLETQSSSRLSYCFVLVMFTHAVVQGFTPMEVQTCVPLKTHTEVHITYISFASL